jgi:acyl-homoserine-lactone acylase
VKQIYFALLIIIAGCNHSDISLDQVRWEHHADNTEIIRDDFGVPHIYGKTDADAVFGLLYAQCEDDFNRVEMNYIRAIGRIAEIEGEKAIYNDLRAQLFMTKEEAIDNYEKSPDWLKKLCEAFADGINYYLFTHPDVQPRLLAHFEPWMPMYFSEGSIGGDIERISTQQIATFYKGDTTSLLSVTHDGLINLKDTEPRGSNGIAIGGKLTKSGKTMLLINPHTSFFFRGEVHVISEEGLNAYGAVTWGQFFVYQGFNEKTGWMHTSTHTDFMDEFVETVTKTDEGFTYKYGDEQRPVDSLKVTLRYTNGKTPKDKIFTIYRTHHGPITYGSDNKWVATAMMWDPVNALIQSYTRTKLNNHKEFRSMMDMCTNSSNNTVFADAEGNIAYYHGNFIPKRDTSFDYTKPVDGSNPATDWQGLHTVDETITVINPATGWIQNCNSTPFTSAGVNSPKIHDYPGYMSINQENFRGVHAIKILQKTSDLTLDKLIKLAYDPYIPMAAVLMTGVIEAYDHSSNPDKSLTEAIELLRNWDYSTSKESVGMSLTLYYSKIYFREGIIPGNMSYIKRINYLGKASPENERLKIFKKALSCLKEDFGSWNTQWGEINRYQRINGDINQAFNDSLPSIPIGLASGNWGALASFGAHTYDGSKRQYGTSGNSFIAVVEFGEKVKAKSLLAGGQSADPKSPHFNDQVQRYADIQFKEVAYYREDVELKAKYVYHPGTKK